MAQQLTLRCQPFPGPVVKPAPLYLAYFLHGGQIHALGYSHVRRDEDGVYVGTPSVPVGSAPANSGFNWGRAQRIWSDSSLKTGNDSLLWSTGIGPPSAGEGNGIFIADVRNGVLRSITSGFSGDLAAAGYYGGFVWAMTWEAEKEAATNTTRYYRMATDLAPGSLEEIATSVTTAAPAEWSPRFAALSAAGIGARGIFGGMSVEFLNAPSGKTGSFAGDVWCRIGAGSGIVQYSGHQGYGSEKQIGWTYNGSEVLSNLLWHNGRPNTVDTEIYEGNGGSWQQAAFPESDWFPGYDPELDPEIGEADPFWASEHNGCYALNGWAVCWLYRIRRAVWFRPMAFGPPVMWTLLQDHPVYGRPEIVTPW